MGVKKATAVLAFLAIVSGLCYCDKKEQPEQKPEAEIKAPEKKPAEETEMNQEEAEEVEEAEYEIPEFLSYEILLAWKDTSTAPPERISKNEGKQVEVFGTVKAGHATAQKEKFPVVPVSQMGTKKPLPSGLTVMIKPEKESIKELAAILKARGYPEDEKVKVLVRGRLKTVKDEKTGRVSLLVKEAEIMEQ